MRRCQSQLDASQVHSEASCSAGVTSVSCSWSGIWTGGTYFETHRRMSLTRPSSPWSRLPIVPDRILAPSRQSKLPWKKDILRVRVREDRLVAIQAINL